MSYTFLRCHANSSFQFEVLRMAFLYGSLLDWYFSDGPVVDASIMTGCLFELQVSTLCCLLIMCMGRV